MGLDATLFRIDFKVNSDLEYNKIRDKAWIEYGEDMKRFAKWEDSIWDEILYTSDWEVANIINSRNIGKKSVDLQENRQLVLDERDILIIIDKMKEKRDDCYNRHIKELEHCLDTTDFNTQTLLYSEWF